MNKGLGIGAAVLACALLCGAVALGSMRRNLEEMRSRLDRVDARLRDLPRQEQVARVEEQLADVRTQVADVRRTALPPAASRPPVPAPTPDDISLLIDRKVEEKLQARTGGDNAPGRRERPLADVAKDLKLDAATQSRMAEVADEAKRLVFDALRTLRPDGGSLADDIAAAMRSGDREKTRAVFTRGFLENVPGTQETYFAVAMRVSEAAMRKVETVLTPEQMTAYRRMAVGPLDLETGYDPLAEYARGK